MENVGFLPFGRFNAKDIGFALQGQYLIAGFCYACQNSHINFLLGDLCRLRLCVSMLFSHASFRCFRSCFFHSLSRRDKVIGRLYVFLLAVFGDEGD